MGKKSLWIALAIAVVVVVVIVFTVMWAPASPSAPGSTVSSTVSYSCDGGATITAAYGSSSVSLALSDGRTLNLPHTVSGSGIRYEAGSGTADDVVFMSEGPNASLMENGSTTYADCLANNAAGASGTNASTSVFTDQGNTFSFDYPLQFSVTGGGAGYTTGWMQNTTSSGIILATLSIPSSFEPGTNFAGATLTVGTSPDASAVAQCLTMTNGNIATSTKTTINGTPFTEIVYGDAAAGNFYNIVSYRTVRNDQCYAVEYVVHSTDILNYPSGTVSQFDQSAVDALLNRMVQSFKFLQ